MSDGANPVRSGSELDVHSVRERTTTQCRYAEVHVNDSYRQDGRILRAGHEHEVRAPIHSGAAETGSHPAVEIHVDARELRVIDKNASERI